MTYYLTGVCLNALLLVIIYYNKYKQIGKVSISVSDIIMILFILALSLASFAILLTLFIIYLWSKVDTNKEIIKIHKSKNGTK